MSFFTEVLGAIFGGSGFAYLPTDWRQVIMIAVACLLLYLGIGKKFEPLLLVPIAFGMLLANLPLTGLFAEPVVDAASHTGTVGFMWVIYQGVQYAIYPSIIFMGIGAMTDFSALISNPKLMLVGAAAQIGIFATYMGALALGFTAAEAGAEDVTDDGEVFTVVTGPSDLFTVRKALQEAGFDYDSADQVMQPKNEVELSLEDARKVSKLIDNLDDLDDVQNIYSNWTASDEVMAQLDEE